MAVTARSSTRPSGGKSVNRVRRNGSRELALVYAGLGWPVFPCRGKTPAYGLGKHPVWAPPADEIGDEPPAAGLTRATTDADVITEHWPDGDDITIGTPAVDRVIVYDVDVPKGDEPLEQRQAIARERYERLRDLHPFVCWVRTPSGGYHGYAARWPDGAKAPATGPYPVGAADRYGELRGLGRAYVIMPGSVTPAGAYEIVDGDMPDISTVPTITADLLMHTAPPNASGNGHATPAELDSIVDAGAGAHKTIGDPTKHAKGTLEGVRSRLGSVKSGRNDECRREAVTLGRWVGGYAAAGLPQLTEAAARDALLAAMIANGDHADDARKAEGTIDRGLRDGMRSAYTVTVKSSSKRDPQDITPPPLTDDDLAAIDASSPDPTPPETTPKSRRKRSKPSYAYAHADPLDLPNITPELVAELARYRLDDLGTAEMLAHVYGDRVLWVPGIGWHVYDGSRWARDQLDEVHRLAARLVRALLVIASKLGSDDARAAMAKHAIRSAKGRAIAIAVDKLRAEQNVHRVGMLADRLDPAPHLLNVANGTVDLRTGKLRPHDPRDLITRVCPVDYDPTATAPLWARFQDEIADGDADLVAYKQRAIGYTATGETSEQALFIAYGSGSNGKSTELELVGEVLGDYATAAPFSTFASGDGQARRFGLAPLAGARYVRATEGNAGDKLAEGIVKALTGSDTVVGEYKGRDQFEFRPRLKLWLGTNHRPETKGTDRGLWRRLQLVPYDVTFTAPTKADPHPHRKLDRELADKLRREMPGILRWIVDGARAWYADGLGEAQRVTDATETYRRDMDALGDYIGEALDLDDPNAVELSSRIYDAYRGWSIEQRQHAIDARAFKAAMIERGMRSTRRKTGVVWLGVKLTPKGEGYADRAQARDQGPYDR
jgi:putative DNA primase/helicase